ncbi:uncharacterized protein C8orf74 homolog [Stegastes partitus]|uniref:Uncharacterized protein C8orf74 homolog n=1 Tax=Stegastes partitus TaxID=144197 RepID=A0A9Y4NEX0_9TELE|nr:PREDICTED: uncharacterized protein LOC103369137 [Stegastes partitus]
MDSLTESEMTQISRLQRDAGVQMLSCHFSWPEFSDERRGFHQEFVYDVATFAADRGFSWSNVIRAAVTAKDMFPQLDDLNGNKLLSMLRDVLCERLPNLTPVHRHELTQYLTDTCFTRQRLFQAVVDGAADVSIVQLHLEVQLPPTPCPLVQGTDLHEGEAQQDLAKVTSELQQKEEELRSLREGSWFTLSKAGMPEDEHLDKQSILEVVHATLRTTKEQIEASLNQEVTLLGEILQLKVQHAALATGRHHNTGHTSRRPDTPAKAKHKTRVKDTGNAV